MRELTSMFRNDDSCRNNVDSSTGKMMIVAAGIETADKQRSNKPRFCHFSRLYFDFMWLAGIFTRLEKKTRLKRLVLLFKYTALLFSQIPYFSLKPIYSL